MQQHSTGIKLRRLSSSRGEDNGVGSSHQGHQAPTTPLFAMVQLNTPVGDCHDSAKFLRESPVTNSTVSTLPPSGVELERETASSKVNQL